MSSVLPEINNGGGHGGSNWKPLNADDIRVVAMITLKIKFSHLMLDLLFRCSLTFRAGSVELKSLIGNIDENFDPFPTFSTSRSVFHFEICLREHMKRRLSYTLYFTILISQKLYISHIPSPLYPKFLRSSPDVHPPAVYTSPPCFSPNCESLQSSCTVWLLQSLH
jgi:hypothetical protein